MRNKEMPLTSDFLIRSFGEADQYHGPHDVMTSTTEFFVWGFIKKFSFTHRKSESHTICRSELSLAQQQSLAKCFKTWEKTEYHPDVCRAMKGTYFVILLLCA
jgi:hypothetical protein